MAKNDEMLKEIMREVTEDLTANLRDVLVSTLEKQLTDALTGALLESEFYKRISKDMRSGLRKIYKDMSITTQDAGPTPLVDKAETDKLFTEASEQLNAVLQQTETATVSIMELLEKHMDYQYAISEMIVKVKVESSAEDWEQIKQMNTEWGDDLTHIMTLLSFQDLTGQRIKKVVSAIKQIEAMALDLYVSSGFMMKAYRDEPEKDIDTLAQEAKAQTEHVKQQVIGSELKGPSANSQADIDDLLAQFDL